MKISYHDYAAPQGGYGANNPYQPRPLGFESVPQMRRPVPGGGNAFAQERGREREEPGGSV